MDSGVLRSDRRYSGRTNLNSGGPNDERHLFDVRDAHIRRARARRCADFRPRAERPRRRIVGAQYGEVPLLAGPANEKPRAFSVESNAFDPPTISVESEPGKGTDVRVFLQAAE